MGIAAAFLATGCSGDTSELEAYIAQVKSRPPAPLEPMPEVTPYKSFTYPDDVKRDPFEPLAFVVPQDPLASSISPDRTRPPEQLEAFPLDGLRMMGTLRQHGTLWALVRDPSGTIHRVKEGNYMGQNFGRIVAIDERSIKLVEIISNGGGGWIERNAALALQD